MLSLIMNICNADFKFSNFVEVMDYFKRIINICKQMNYSVFHSEDFEKYEKELNKILEERKIVNSSN